jgi:hypothetical protein
MPKAFLIKKNYWLDRRTPVEKGKIIQEETVLAAAVAPAIFVSPAKSTDGGSVLQHRSCSSSSAFEVFVNSAGKTAACVTSGPLIYTSVGPAAGRYAPTHHHDNKCLCCSKIDATGRRDRTVCSSPTAAINLATGMAGCISGITVLCAASVSGWGACVAGIR